MFSYRAFQQVSPATHDFFSRDLGRYHSFEEETPGCGEEDRAHRSPLRSLACTNSREELKLKDESQRFLRVSPHTIPMLGLLESQREEDACPGREFPAGPGLASFDIAVGKIRIQRPRQVKQAAKELGQVNEKWRFGSPGSAEWKSLLETNPDAQVMETMIRDLRSLQEFYEDAARKGFWMFLILA